MYFAKISTSLPQKDERNRPDILCARPTLASKDLASSTVGLTSLHTQQLCREKAQFRVEGLQPVKVFGLWIQDCVVEGYRFRGRIILFFDGFQLELGSGFSCSCPGWELLSFSLESDLAC